MSRRPYARFMTIKDDFPERLYRIGPWIGFTLRERRIIEAYLDRWYPGRRAAERCRVGRGDAERGTPLALPAPPLGVSPAPGAIAPRPPGGPMRPAAAPPPRKPRGLGRAPRERSTPCR